MSTYIHHRLDAQRAIDPAALARNSVEKLYSPSGSDKEGPAQYFDLTYLFVLARYVLREMRHLVTRHG